MYCSSCRRQLFYKDLDKLGWCDSCRDVVHVSRCGVSYWILAAAMFIIWSVPSGF
jgi:hypothetical protein